MRDFKTTLAGYIGLGFIVSSFLAKNPDTSNKLMGIGMAFGLGGLTQAADSKGPTKTTTVVQQPATEIPTTTTITTKE